MPPFKVCSKTDQPRYGIVASSLQELIGKGVEKLQMHPDRVRVQLEDGTIVEDEDYFACIDPNTVLVFTEQLLHDDQVDADYNVTGQTGNQANLLTLMVMLRDDLANIIRFSMKDLEVVANADPKELMSCLPMARDDVISLQEACHNHLVEKEKTTDALNLLDLHGPDGASSGHKRARVS